jgi:hypothetical protein
MNEEAARIFSSDRIECLAYDFHQRLSCPGTNLAQNTLDLRKSLLNRIEVRRIGWQVQQFASSSFDQLPDPFALMCPEVVHYHYLSQSQLGSQKVLPVEASKTSLAVEHSIAIEGPIPSQLMLAKRVVFLPLFLGILKKAHLPRGE